ncbi:MAG: dienelactone hydrolase family protein [Acetobacteraceae bacterium]
MNGAVAGLHDPGETVALSARDGHTLSAYRAVPDRCRRGVVVAQESFGVTRHLRRVCDRLAAAGYAAIAPALFDRARRGVELGASPEEVALGRELRGRIDPGAVLADLEAAADALPRGIPVGLLGFRWGGTVAWWGATRLRRFAAASAWYGGGIAAARRERPACPVQMHFGEHDDSIPLSDVAAIRVAQPKVEIHVYPAARHGFGCEERATYSAPDAEAAWTRTHAFFARHLG